MFFLGSRKRSSKLEKGVVTIAGLDVEVWWKAVKKVHLVVYAVDARVRIPVPPFTTVAEVEQFVLGRIDWVKEKRAKLLAREPVAPLTYIEGEAHLLWGKEYPLRVREGSRRHHVHFSSEAGIELYLRRNHSSAQRQNLLLQWYRQQLQLSVPPLLEKWQPQIGVTVAEVRIKRMKTRWGTCNIAKRRIWLNLELIKKPEACVEYILVHEMIHLLEPYHNARFYAYQDTFLPGWQQTDSLLTQDT